MKTIVRLGGINLHRLGEELYRQIHQICPECFKYDMLSSAFVLGDDRLAAIEALLREHGFARVGFRDIERQGTLSYHVRLDREYTSEELAGFRYFCVRTDDKYDIFEQLPPTTNGIVRLCDSDFAEHIDFGVAKEMAIVVSDRVQRIIEASRLVGVKFSPTQRWSSHLQSEAHEMNWAERDPWWELTTDLLLPPLPVANQFVPHPGWGIPNSPKVMMLVEGDFYPPQIKLSSQALKPLGEFDIAQTSETFNFRPNEDARYTIVSQRFRQVCLANSIRIPLTPVQMLP